MKLIVTFHTTAEAMAMESVCRESGVPGRLIPVPRQISAGCGLSWSMPVEWKDKMDAFMQEHQIHYEEMGEYLI